MRKLFIANNPLPHRKLSSVFTTFCCLIIGLFFQANAIFGQSPCTPCSASDIKVLGGELTDIAGNPLPSGCTPGTTTYTVYLKINLDVTSTTRYGFLITGQVVVGGTTTYNIAKCFPETLTSGPRSYILTEFPITWPCGSTIQLNNVFTAWSQNAPTTPGVYEVCGLYNNGTYSCNELTPKCKFYGPGEEVTIVAPLVANYTYSSVCPGNTSFKKITFSSPATGVGATTGGVTPYSYLWTITDAVTNTQLATSTANPFDYTPTGPNNLSVKLEVKDTEVPGDNTGDPPKHAQQTDEETKIVSPEACCTTPVISNKTATICSGDAFSITPANGGAEVVPAGTTYTWPVPVSNPVGAVTGGSAQSTGAVAPISQTLSNTTNAVATLTYIVTPTSGSCTGNTFTVTVTVSAASVGGTAATAQTICYNTAPADLTLSGNTGSVTKWQKSADAAFTTPIDIPSSAGTPLTGATIGNLIADTWFRAVVQNGTGCATANSSPVKITVSAASVGGTAATAQTICYNTAPADLTLSGNTGSVTKWQKSADAAFTTPIDIPSSAGTPLTGATIGNLTADTWFRAVVQNGAGCATDNSSSVKITVNPATVGGTVASDQTICYNTAPANLTLSGNVGSVTKWQKSSTLGFDAGTVTDISVTSTTLTGATIGNLTADTWFRAVVQNGAGCATDNSSSVKITVNPATVGGTVASDQTICYNTAPANLTLSGNVGSVTKWQKSSTLGFDAGTVTDISVTSTTLTGATIGNLTADTWFRAVVQSGTGCVVQNSSSVKITVNPATVGGTVASDQTICYNTAPANLTLSGNVGSVTKWQKSSTLGFDAGTVTDISVTSTTLTGATIGNLTADTWFRAVVQSGTGCVVQNSSSVKITVNPATVGGTVASDQTICYNTAPANLTLSGNVGSVTKWQKSSTLGFDAGTVTDISVTSTTLTGATIGNLTADTWFRAVVQSGTGCVVQNSSSVKITVNPATVGGTVASDQTICYNTAPANLTLSGNVGSVTKWQKSSTLGFDAGTVTDISVTSTTLTGATIGNLTADTWFRAVVQSGTGCVVQNSSSVKITVNPATVGGTVASDQTICYNTAPANLTLSGNVGSVTKWQKSSTLGFDAGTVTDISVTSTTLTGATIGNLTADTWFRAVVQSGTGCVVQNSSSVKITVNPATVGGTVASDQTICYNTAPANLTLSGNVGSVTKWQKSSTLGFDAGTVTDISVTSTTLTGATIGNLTADTWFRAVVRSGTGCAIANSSAVKITVESVSLVTHAPTAPCTPGTVDLTAGAVTSGSTLPNGTILTYWTTYNIVTGAVSGQINPATAVSAGTYYIKATSPAGCTDIKSVTIAVNNCGGAIYATATTCNTFLAGENTLDKICYTVTPAIKKGGGGTTYSITNATPGVFFYYAKVKSPGTAPFIVYIDQFNTSNTGSAINLHPANLPNFAVQKGQVFAFNSSCTKIATGAATSNANPGDAQITISGVPKDQDVVISVKYDVKTIVGQSLTNIVGPDYNAYFISKVNGTIDNNTAGNIHVYNCSAAAAPLTAARTSPEAEVNARNTSVTVYPNPFSDQVSFNILSPVSGRAILETHDFLGRKMAVIYQGNVEAGVQRTVTYKIPATQRVPMIYTLRIGGQLINGKLFPNGAIHY